MAVPQDTALPAAVPTVSSQEGSPVMSEVLESSTLGSVTSDESEGGLPSDFRRTLAAARATADKAAEMRQREKEVLEELSRVAENVPFSSRTQSERVSSPESTSSLQSQELVNVSTPSTLSLSVTMSSELSVTSVMSRTSQTRLAPHFFDRTLPLTTQSRSPFSDVANTTSITAATSLLTKTSQDLGFPRPSSSTTQPLFVLSSGSRLDTHISGVLPSTISSSRAIAGPSARNPLLFTSSSGSGQARDFNVPQTSVIQQSSPSYSTAPGSKVMADPSVRNTSVFTSVSGSVGIPQSSAFQQSSPGYSPGYLDYYHKKIEEERQLFEAQRNRIRRYGDLFKKSSQEGLGAQTYQVSGSTSKNVPPVELHAKTTPYLSGLHGSAPTYLVRNVGAIGFDTNKENEGYIANTAAFRGQDRLRNISQRLGAFEKSLTTDDPSTVVTSSTYTSKPLSTSERSYGSSRTEYMSLPRESAGLGFAGSAGSTLSSLSELTEMMTRLTSTSDESEDKSPRVGAPGGQPRADHAPEGTSKVGLCLSVGHTPLTSLERDLILRGSSRDRVYVPSSVGTLDIARSTSRDTSAKISGPQEPSVKVPGSRWTKGSDGKQWFMLSRSSTLSSVGGVLGKDSIPPAGEGEDNVFPDAREDKSKSLYYLH